MLLPAVESSAFEEASFLNMPWHEQRPRPNIATNQLFFILHIFILLILQTACPYCEISKLVASAAASLTYQLIQVASLNGIATIYYPYQFFPMVGQNNFKKVLPITAELILFILALNAGFSSAVPWGAKKKF
jgi:hypothetical protein